MSLCQLCFPCPVLMYTNMFCQCEGHLGYTIVGAIHTLYIYCSIIDAIFVCVVHMYICGSVSLVVAVTPRKKSRAFSFPKRVGLQLWLQCSQNSFQNADMIANYRSYGVRKTMTFLIERKTLEQNITPATFLNVSWCGTKVAPRMMYLKIVAHFSWPSLTFLDSLRLIRCSTIACICDELKALS